MWHGPVCQEAYHTVTHHDPDEGDKKELMTGTLHHKQRPDQQPYRRLILILRSPLLCLRGSVQFQVSITIHWALMVRKRL